MTDACLDAETLAAWTDGRPARRARSKPCSCTWRTARAVRHLAGTLARISSTVPPAETGPRRRGAGSRGSCRSPPRRPRWRVVVRCSRQPGASDRSAQPRRRSRLRRAGRQRVRTDAADVHGVGGAQRRSEPQGAGSAAPVAGTAGRRRRRSAARARHAAQPAAEERGRAGVCAAAISRKTSESSVAQPPAAPAAARGRARSGCRVAPAASVWRLPRMRAVAVARRSSRPIPRSAGGLRGRPCSIPSNGGSTWETVPSAAPPTLDRGRRAGGHRLLAGRPRRRRAAHRRTAAPWRRLPFPEMTDLSAVRAGRRRRARRVRFDRRTAGRLSTTDAGASWIGPLTPSA